MIIPFQYLFWNLCNVSIFVVIGNRATQLQLNAKFENYKHNNDLFSLTVVTIDSLAKSRYIFEIQIIFSAPYLLYPLPI